MNAPLSRYLTSFSPPDTPKLVVVEPPDMEPEPELEVEPEPQPERAVEAEPVETALDVALRELRDETARTRAQEIAALEATQAEALKSALVAARAEWAAANADAIGTLIDGALAHLRAMLSERVAVVLRPLLAEAILARTLEVINQTIVRILADPDHPCLTVRGPRDLVEALRARAPEGAGTIYETADSMEVTVTADGMHVETRLGHALAALEGPEPEA